MLKSSIVVRASGWEPARESTLPFSSGASVATETPKGATSGLTVTARLTVAGWAPPPEIVAELEK